MSLRRLGVGNSSSSGRPAHSGGCVTASGVSACTSSSPVALQCAVRTHMNGFSLFTRQLQKSKNALSAKNLQEGQANATKAAALWRSLGKRERENYNRRARAMTVVRTNDNEKRYNLFNLTMKLLAETKIFSGVGSEKLNAWMARETARRLSPKAAQQLRQRYRAVAQPSQQQQHPQHAAGTRTATTPAAAIATTASGVTYANVALAMGAGGAAAGTTRAVLPGFGVLYRGFHFPSMRHFGSFTEMQRGVCPTAQSLFTSTCLLSRVNVSHSTYVSTAERFHLLPPDAQDMFGPITDAESPAFEAFCARPAHCAWQDPENFNIVLLTALFRRLPVAKREPTPHQYSVYRGIATVERVRDGPYVKTQRCLARLQHSRSSECGDFLFHHLPEDGVAVPRGAYGVQQATSLGDVTVAWLLSRTRRGQSVYDDVLKRAAPLRPAAQQKLLRMYDVAATQQERQAAFAVAATVKPRVMVQRRAAKVATKQPVKKAARLEAKTAKTVKSHATREQTETHTPTLVVAAKPVAAVAAPEAEARPTPTLGVTRSRKTTPKAAARSRKVRTAATKQKRTTAAAAKPVRVRQSRVVAARAPTKSSKSTKSTAAIPTPTALVVSAPASPRALAELDENVVADEDGEAALDLFASEEDATTAAATARHAAALEAIAAIGLNPAKASQRVQRVQRSTRAARPAAPREALTASSPTRAETPKTAAPTPARRGAGKAPITRARQKVKSAAATATTASTKTSSTTAAPARPRETREERQKRVQKVLLSGKKQRILHRHHAPTAGATGNNKARRGRGGKSSSLAKAHVANSLANALRAQLSNMQS